MKRRPPDPQSPQAPWDRQHTLHATLPVSWVLQADELLAAFELIVAKELDSIASPPALSAVAYMLVGFAVEDLLKGILVGNGEGLNEEGRFSLKSHDLPALAERVGFALAAKEKLLLERLTEYVEWAGRYPIPLTSEPMRPRTMPEGGFAPVTYHRVGEDWAAARGFVARLKAKLPRMAY